MDKIIYCWNCTRCDRLCSGYVRCYGHPITVVTERGDGFCSHAEARKYQSNIGNIRKRLDKNT